jgi:hypothetical protein
MTVNKALLFLIAGFTFIRLTVWGLIGNCTALAPDEGGYFQLFKYINNTQAVRPTLHWAGTPKWVLEVFFVPAKIFDLFGLSEFQAFRLQSIVLSLGAFALILISFRNLGFFNRFQSLNQRNKKLFLVFLALALFMPSNIIWTFLGLREPFIHFSLALIFISFGSYFQNKSLTFPWLIVYFIGLVILGFTKFYLVILIIIATGLTLILLYKLQEVKKLGIMLIVTMLCLPVFSQQVKEVNWPNVSFSTTKLSFDFLPDYEAPSLPSMTYLQIKSCLDADKAGPLLALSIRVFEKLTPIRTQMADSQIPIDESSSLALRSDENLRSYLNLFNLPFGLVNFLLFPISILDSSLFGLLGLVETIFWLPLYLLLSIQIARSRKGIRENPLLLACLVFISIFATFSALAEVNFGTALRHRSVLLVPMILLAISTWQNKPSKPDS